MGKIKKRVSQAESLAQLLGLEGNASAHYFATFDTLLKTETGFRFQKRSQRPPKAPVNALLSFAYSLLALDLSSAIQLVGLDPYIGFYHQQTYGRPCLALDLMEEFRSVIADSVVITLINNRQILVDDFEVKNGEMVVSTLNPMPARFFMPPMRNGKTTKSLTLFSAINCPNGG